MKGFIEGRSRDQATLFPERIDDYIDEDSAVRVIQQIDESIERYLGLRRRTKSREGNLIIYRYWSSVCGSCSLKSKCTTGKERRVSRWEHEAYLDAAEARLDREPERMRVRRCTAEHPIGTLKSWMGHMHFLMKTKRHVGTEMSLHVLTCNLKRVINIVGTQSLIAAMRA